jgi:hypothetical protein
MFDLFDGETGIINDYDDDKAPLPPGADVLGRSRLRSFGRNPLWG